MRKNVQYAVARRTGAIAVSLDEAENLLERRGSADPREWDAGASAAGPEIPIHQRRATDQPHSGLRQQAGPRVRGLLSRVWHSLFPARGTHDNSSAP